MDIDDMASLMAQSLPSLPPPAGEGGFSAAQLEAFAFVAMERLLVAQEEFSGLARPARIADLEQALKTVHQYLVALPPHPQTYRHAQAAEAVLSKAPVGMVAYEGGRWTPAGIMVLGAKLDGTTLTVTSADVDSFGEDVVNRHVRGLYKSLKEGVTFEIRQAGPSSSQSSAAVQIGLPD